MFDLFLLCLGRCGICNKVWLGPCYHQHPNGIQGHYITQRVRMVLRWDKIKMPYEKRPGSGGLNGHAE